MTCAQLGGPCEKMLMGETADELVQQGYTHVMESHPEIVQQMSQMSETEMAAWNAEFQKKWDQTPANA